MLVLVINKHGQPLMPTTPRKARIFLQSGKAKIVGRDPFTIQLIYGSSGYKQPISLGIDAGYKNIGFSAITQKEELIGGEVELLDGVSERITEKKKYRRTRRNRLRHRAKRFDNRKRNEGWLAPSIQHKLDTHLRFVERVKSRLPITKITVETASFDIQKLKNPDIQGDGYQQGEQLGYKNLTNYIRHRDGYKCQNPDCKNKGADKVLQVHHIGYWKNPPDRSNRPSNLITLCDKCHSSPNHKKGKILHGWQPKVKSFKAETFMSTIYKRILEDLCAEEAFGYETDFKRKELKLEKSHHNDAFIIAGGTIQQRTEPLMIEQIRRHKRSMEQFYDAKYIDKRTGEKVAGSILNSGRRTRNKNLNGENLRVYRGNKVSKGQRRIKKQRYRYNPKDYVMFENNVYRVVGMQNLGTGVKLANYPGVANKVVNVNKVQSIRRRSGLCVHA
ncbi:RNA-guided endonuclease IscB [Aetokthonos hydrillicola Thurmond2011]|jgi:5-methylcytosine-specific restriction endonuclease McrA|uniref:RNA-guided endonuclease IscB n=5 Tax=Aetokthonos TaxID=1550243 RepID=A0AAP5I6Q3_9CYAN|nr:RNA-guided endonuclease IscB [Aetokthonos hydrillicola]MBW4588665.1 HNH endonuclease [Aetokthonos hydrillicola CCALA 1050]MDR9896002.1 RNA-guided endonuclease IscB [Aetokthonos hydrillicola Thurmond2011]